MLMICSKCGKTYEDGTDHEIDISRNCRHNEKSSPYMVHVFLCPRCEDHVLAWLDGRD